MSRNVLLLFTVFCLLIASVPLSADDDMPLVAIMGYGWFPSFEATEGAIFDMLQFYGFVNAKENAMLQSREDLEAENINIFWGDPGRGRDALNLAVENALDREPVYC